MTSNPASSTGPQPFRRDPKPLMHPRRVRGGVRLKTKEGQTPASWAAQRVLRVIEQAAPGGALREGLEYARQGQTRRIEYEGGRAQASVQGRSSRPYKTIVGLKQFSETERERVIAAMGDQALYAAKLLAGELPTNIEDLFAPLELRLFPVDGDDFELSCSCRESGKPWCKHAVCVAALLAERLGEDALLIFSLRGLDGQELIQRLREHRSLAGRGDQAHDLYSPRPPEGLEEASPALEEVVDRFWDAGPELAEVDLPITPPEAGHVLLRRLGASPFPEGRFPLLGLLATCYELIGAEALRGPGDESPEERGEGADEPAGGGNEAD
ncbi:MAG: hypothetical protein R3B57_02150 [Phycisphaerales bacterium]